MQTGDAATCESPAQGCKSLKSKKKKRKKEIKSELTKAETTAQNTSISTVMLLCVLHQTKFKVTLKNGTSQDTSFDDL